MRYFLRLLMRRWLHGLTRAWQVELCHCERIGVKLFQLQDVSTTGSRSSRVRREICMRLRCAIFGVYEFRLFCVLLRLMRQCSELQLYYDQKFTSVNWGVRYFFMMKNICFDDLHTHWWLLCISNSPISSLVSNDDQLLGPCTRLTGLIK